jgi:hypothetical protein
MWRAAFQCINGAGELFDPAEVSVVCCVNACMRRCFNAFSVFGFLGTRPRVGVRGAQANPRLKDGTALRLGEWGAGEQETGRQGDGETGRRGDGETGR